MSAVRMIDREKLQMIQDLVCAFAGVSAIVLDKNRMALARSVMTA